MRSISLGLIACSAFLLLPDVAWAAPARKEGFHSAGFLYGALPFLSIPVGDDPTRPEHVKDISFQWGVGGGYLFVPTTHFMLTVGAAFEHAWVNYENREPSEFRRDIVRLLPEVRVGGGNRRIFGYACAQPGLAVRVTVWDWTSNALPWPLEWSLASVISDPAEPLVLEDASDVEALRAIRNDYHEGNVEPDALKNTGHLFFTDDDHIYEFWMRDVLPLEDENGRIDLE